MVAVDMGWTPTKLKTVVNALDDTLALLPEEDRRMTEADKVALATWRLSDKSDLRGNDVKKAIALTQLWTEDAREILKHPNQDDGTFRATDVPKFPLTSQQLLALQASIERLALARAAETIEHAEGTSEHIQSSFRHLTITAYILGGVLFVGAILTSLVLLHQLYPDWLGWLSKLAQVVPDALTPALKIVAIAIPWIAFAFWVLELARLYRHQYMLKQSGHALRPLHKFELYLSAISNSLFEHSTRAS